MVEYYATGLKPRCKKNIFSHSLFRAVKGKISVSPDFVIC